MDDGKRMFRRICLAVEFLVVLDLSGLFDEDVYN